MDITPLVTQDYRPEKPDEQGMWHSCEQIEEALASSKIRIQDATLTDYLTEVVTRLTEGVTTRVRVYPLWDPTFNAGMYPNGMMVVNSGLLARVRNEAQLAAVLGHECGHYLRQHTLKNWRSRRAKAAAAAFIAAGANIASGATGTNYYDLANSINHTLVASMYQYSQELESEADSYGLKLLAERGYPPEAAAQVWAQLIEEGKAAAQARKRRFKESRSAYSTHPPASDRMRDLTETAELWRMRAGGAEPDERREFLMDAIRPLRPQLIEEQIKLNNPGASLYLLSSLAQDGWDGVLRYFEGEVYRMRDEPGDQARATEAYAAAVALPDAPAQAYRAHGYALLKAGEHEAGRASLRRYLEMQPDASDAPMIQFTLKQ